MNVSGITGIVLLIAFLMEVITSGAWIFIIILFIIVGISQDDRKIKTIERLVKIAEQLEYAYYKERKNEYHY